MTSYLRALYHYFGTAAVATMVLLAVSTSVHAELSAEQKDKIRAALPAPSFSFSPSFKLSSRGSFELSINGNKETTTKARLAFLLQAGPPKDRTNRLLYFRRVGDLQRTLRQAVSSDTYDQGEKLALSLAETGSPRLRARFLALAAGFHTEQGEDDAAQDAANQALVLEPDTWEAWQVRALLLNTQMIRVIGAEAFADDNSAVQRWIDAKPSAEARNRAVRLATEVVAAIGKAVTLQEKAVGVPEYRNPQPYLLRIRFRATADALRESLADQPVSFLTKFEERLVDKEAIRDIGNAAISEPQNPYTLGAYYCTRAIKKSVSKAKEEYKTGFFALNELDKKTLPDRETRLQLLEVQALLSVLREKGEDAAAKAKEGLLLSPDRRTFRTIYPIGLMQQKKFAEAEVFASRQLANEDTTQNRFLLARTQLEQNDFAGAERTLIPLYERDNTTALPAVFLATVRLKATTTGTTNADWSALQAFLENIAAQYPGNMGDAKTEYALVLATFDALTDRVEQAKSILRNMLNVGKGNKAAKELLALLP